MTEPSPTREEVLKSIVPNGTQLNADDLLTGPITVTITKVRRGDKEQPIIVELDGHKPYKPCKTMRRVLIRFFSDDPTKWVGQRMTLFCDPDVLWAGVKVGGIRISHLSGIDTPHTVMLTTTRGKRSEFVFHPLATITPEDQEFIDTASVELASADSVELLEGYAVTIKTKSKAIQDALRPIYAKRLKELSE